MAKYNKFMIVSDIAHLSEQTIKNAVNSKPFEKFAYILHDKDRDENNNLKPKHWHIVVKTNNMYTFKTIANKFGIAPNFVVKIKGTFADALLYLTHENAKEKYQYNEVEVKANFLWRKEKEQSKITKNRRLKEIAYKIEKMEITRYNLLDNITMFEYQEWYDKHISKYLKYVEEKEAIKLQVNGRNMQVIYIQGASGSGKSTYAKKIARDRGLSFYVSSGSNDILDGYKGEQCLILDDLRPSCIGLSDLLKLLDNHTSSSTKSRYYNKNIACKLIIITTILDIDIFFKNVFENEQEPKEQLFRRCETLLKLSDDMMEIYQYNKKDRLYHLLEIVENPVKNFIGNIEKQKSKEETFKILGIKKEDIKIINDPFNGNPFEED